jgi:hypothetical protein
MSKVETALASLGDQVREAFLAHLRGGTSAAWLADWLTRAGHPVGATTIKDYRKRVANADL